MEAESNVFGNMDLRVLILRNRFKLHLKTAVIEHSNVSNTMSDVMHVEV